MNILFVIKQYPNYGGIEVVTSMLSRKFLADGHRVFIVSLFHSNIDNAQEMVPEGVEVFELPVSIWKMRGIAFLHHLVLEKKIDVMINQWALRFDVGIACYIARKGTACKIVSVLHGAADTTKLIIEQKEHLISSKTIIGKCYNWIKLAFYHRLTRFSVKAIYKMSESYVLLSESFIPQLMHYAKLKDGNKIKAIGNAISIPVNGYKYDFESKDKTILYVGRMDQYNKRVNRVIEAWEQVFSEFPDWDLKLVGEGPQLKYLKEYVREHEIERVSFYGFQKDPPIQFYKKASILMLTSDLEGFGLVIIEAMQFGVIPVVYGSYVAVYDIITNGRDGFITPMPYSKDYTVECIKQLVCKSELRKKMAHEAIVKSHDFSLDNIALKWYGLFGSIGVA